jgi:hypothetical protein
VDADVLVAVEVVLTDSEGTLDVTDAEDDSDELKDEVESWPFVKVALLESKLGCAVTVSDGDSEADDEVGA